MNLYTYCHNNPILYWDPTENNVWTLLVDEFVYNWKLGASGFKDNWQAGINELQNSGNGGKLFASYSMGVADTISSQASSTINVIRNPGEAISNIAKDYVSYGKKDFKNWIPTSYLGTQIGNGLINKAKSSYNLGAEYGAEGVMYALGQSTTILAQTGVSAYGPQVVSSGFNAANNSISNVISKIRTTSVNPLANIKYTEKVLYQATLNDYHGFPEHVDAFGGDGVVTSIIGGDGIIRTQIEIAGGYKNTNGVFQYIIESDGITCNHRVFVPK